MNERKNAYVPVLMTPAELAALRSAASARSCSVGAVVRWAIRQTYIDPPSPRNESKEAPKFAQTSGASLSGIQS